MAISSTILRGTHSITPSDWRSCSPSGPRSLLNSNTGMIVHGDFQHGNILVVPDVVKTRAAVTLVDYDGMTVPGLDDRVPTDEIGHSRVPTSRTKSRQERERARSRSLPRPRDPRPPYAASALPGGNCGRGSTRITCFSGRRTSRIRTVPLCLPSFAAATIRSRDGWLVPWNVRAASRSKTPLRWKLSSTAPQFPRAFRHPMRPKPPNRQRNRLPPRNARPGRKRPALIAVSFSPPPASRSIATQSSSGELGRPHRLRALAMGMRYPGRLVWKVTHQPMQRGNPHPLPEWVQRASRANPISSPSAFRKPQPSPSPWWSCPLLRSPRVSCSPPRNDECLCRFHREEVGCQSLVIAR